MYQIQYCQTSLQNTTFLNYLSVNCISDRYRFLLLTIHWYQLLPMANLVTKVLIKSM